MVLGGAHGTTTRRHRAATTPQTRRKPRSGRRGTTLMFESCWTGGEYVTHSGAHEPAARPSRSHIGAAPRLDCAALVSVGSACAQQMSEFVAVGDAEFGEDAVEVSLHGA